MHTLCDKTWNILYRAIINQVLSWDAISEAGSRLPIERERSIGRNESFVIDVG